MSNKKLINSFLCMCFLMAFASPSLAMHGVIFSHNSEDGTPEGCWLRGTTGVMPYMGTSTCMPYGSPVFFTKGFVYGGGYTGAWEASLSSTFPPYTGSYSLRLSFCPSEIPVQAPGCSVAKRTRYITTPPITLSSSIAMSSSSYRFPNAPLMSPGVSGSVCLTAVDSFGKEWGISNGLGYNCKDVGNFPSVPAICYINQGRNLDVQLGELERGAIAVRPQTTNTVKKQVSVLCTRDAGITLNMQFDYTPLTIGGEQLIKSSTDGLGVAIIYNGKVVKPTDITTLKYDVGYSYINLEFEAVRDPNIKLREIKTGDFTATAVMIMTVQ